jgi:opacity protein-like surface antigen
MRKLSLIAALTLFAWAVSARAQDETPTPEGSAEPASSEAEPAGAAAEPAASPASKMQLGIAFLPMVLGKLTAGASNDNSTYDISTAYGIGLSFGYNVIAGLSVGIAPQVLFGLTAKDDVSGYEMISSEKEFDIMARIAYAYPVIPKLTVYGELLPGYSIVTYDKSIMGSTPPKPKGLVLAIGAGAAFDVTDLFFVNLAVGYQLGFQKTSPEGSDTQDVKTRFLRIALGGGVRF